MPTNKHLSYHCMMRRKQGIICFQLVEHSFLEIGIAIHFKIIDNVLKKVSPLNLASKVVVQPCDVDVEVKELRHIMHKNSKLIAARKSGEPR